MPGRSGLHCKAGSCRFTIEAVAWQVGRSARTTVVATQGASTLRDNIVTVFGSRVADGLEQLRVNGPSCASISGHA